MKLYTFYTKEYDGIYRRFFLQTLKKVEPNLDFHAEKIDSKDCSRPEVKKWELLQEWVAQNRGRQIIWTDVDSVFLNPFAQKTSEDTIEFDLAFAFNRIINPSFIVLSCNDRVEEFINKILMFLGTGRSEKYALNTALKNAKFSYKVLSDNYGNALKISIKPFVFHATPTNFGPLKFKIREKTEMLYEACRKKIKPILM